MRVMTGIDTQACSVRRLFLCDRLVLGLVLLALTTAVPACRRVSTEEDPNAEGPPTTLSQDELAEAYSNLGVFLAEARTDRVWRMFKGKQQAVLSAVDDTLQIEATGDDPVVIIPGSLVAGKRFMVEVVIESPAQTFAQMYFLTKGQRDYTEHHSQLAELTPGKNIIYFRLDHPNLAGSLRFDPGKVPGVYRVSSMNAMEMVNGDDDDDDDGEEAD